MLKIAQRDPKMAPRWPQDGPKMVLRGPKMALRGPKMAPGWAREGFKTPVEHIPEIVQKTSYFTVQTPPPGNATRSKKVPRWPRETPT